MALDEQSPGAAGLGGTDSRLWPARAEGSAGSSPGSSDARRAPAREGQDVPAGAAPREAPSATRPGDAARRVRTGPRRSAADLPAHGLVGQLAHAIELLLHRGAAAARVGAGEGRAEQLASAAGLHGSREEPPGDSGGTAEPPEAARPAAAPSRGDTAAYSLSRLGVCCRSFLVLRDAVILKPEAGWRPQRPGSVPALCPSRPRKAQGPPVSRRLAGHLAGWASLRLCGRRRAFWDL